MKFYLYMIDPLFGTLKVYDILYKSGRVLGVSSPGFGLGGGAGDETS